MISPSPISPTSPLASTVIPLLTSARAPVRALEASASGTPIILTIWKGRLMVRLAVVPSSLRTARIPRLSPAAMPHSSMLSLSMVIRFSVKARSVKGYVVVSLV